MEQKEQIDALQKQLGEFLEKSKAEIEATGRTAQETKSSLEDIRTQLANLQKQTDAIDKRSQEKTIAMDPGKSVIESIKENTALQSWCRNQYGVLKIDFDAKQVKEIWQRKTAIMDSVVGLATSGVLPIDRIPGIVREARQTLMLRQALSARPTDKATVDFVYVSTPPGYGSPQTEGSAKFQNYAVFSTKQLNIVTIATWIPASKQVLEDMDELANYITETLPYYVDLDEEYELLSGDASSGHYSGLTHNATAFTTTLTHAAAGWNKIDLIGRAIQQIMTAKELPPTFVVLNPVDYWDIRLTKDSYGRYIFGDPQDFGPGIQFGGTVNNPRTIFGLTPVVTTAMTSGYFLVGSGNPVAAEIRDRMGMQIEISTSHEDFFVRNLLAIRAERRACLVVKRAASFIYGALNTSPANY
jgi:HK97 family phage major capsid protein